MKSEVKNFLYKVNEAISDLEAIYRESSESDEIRVEVLPLLDNANTVIGDLRQLIERHENLGR